jgi:uncharacterized membrane protein
MAIPCCAGVNLRRIQLDRDEYQRLRRQLDEELRAGIEMLQAGHRAKVEALDARWREPAEPEQTGPVSAAAELAAVEVVSPEPAVQAAPVPVPPEPASKRRAAWEVYSDVEEALAAVGEEFGTNDLLRAMSYTPHRSSLHRALRELENDGVIKIQSYGGGRRPTRYRKRPREVPS